MLGIRCRVIGLHASKHSTGGNPVDEPTPDKIRVNTVKLLHCRRGYAGIT